MIWFICLVAASIPERLGGKRGEDVELAELTTRSKYGRQTGRGVNLRDCVYVCVCAVTGACVQPSVSNVSERGALLMKHFSRSDNYTSRKQGHLQSTCET